MFHPDDALFVPLYDHSGRWSVCWTCTSRSTARSPTRRRCSSCRCSPTWPPAPSRTLTGRSWAAAVTDGLTGLFNHRHSRRPWPSKSSGRPLRARLRPADDGPRLLQDGERPFGHPHGDEALQQVAAVLRVRTRARAIRGALRRRGVRHDPAGHDGEAGRRRGRAIAQDVREISSTCEPPRLSISVGMADYPACGHERESLIAAADAALLFAKRSGRDMVADFSQTSLVELDQSALEGLSFRLERADHGDPRVARRRRRPSATPSPGSTGRPRVSSSPPAPGHGLGLDEAETELLHTVAARLRHRQGRDPRRVLNRRGDLMPRAGDDQAATPRWASACSESVMRLRAALPAVLHHHERWDGAGYPDGLAGEGSRCRAGHLVCDAYHAMTPTGPTATRVAGDAPGSCGPARGRSSTRRSSTCSSARWKPTSCAAQESTPGRSRRRSR